MSERVLASDCERVKLPHGLVAVYVLRRPHARPAEAPPSDLPAHRGHIPAPW